jgi:hypothetical protein
VIDKAQDGSLAETRNTDRAPGRGLLKGSRDVLRDLADAPIDSHLERITKVMDRAIRVPGTDIRIGLDPILGFFFPVAGDTIATLISSYIVLISIRHGLPKSAITRMVFNVGVDFVIGAIPFIGDIFDFTWKSNEKNMRLLRKYATGKRGSIWTDWAWVIVLLIGLFALVFALIAFAFYQVAQIDLWPY